MKNEVYVIIENTYDGGILFGKTAYKHHKEAEKVVDWLIQQERNECAHDSSYIPGLGYDIVALKIK